MGRIKKKRVCVCWLEEMDEIKKGDKRRLLSVCKEGNKREGRKNNGNKERRN